MPASARAAPTSPPTSACAELEGSPRHQVRRFQSVAARTPDADHRDRLRRGDRDDPGDRVGHRGADQQRAEHVEDRGEGDRLPGPRAPRRDERRDRVGGVVEPVGQREGDREGDGEAEFHAAIIHLRERPPGWPRTLQREAR